MIPHAVYRETLLRFLGPVREYLEDPSVSEIMINGPSQVFVERKGRLERVGATFNSVEEVTRVLRNAAQMVGKFVDESNPILEARLPDGSRIQGMIPPIAEDGPYVAIRRFQQSFLTEKRLVELGSLTSGALETLRALVGAKLNIMIAGGTGSGKTSLLNLMSSFVPEQERIAVIEDSREVQVQREHVIMLEARKPDPHGLGAITIRDLFRATLRMRPDRIIIGEIRGGEAVDIIQAMVSGHGGCMGTLHATYPRDTLTRLETMGMMSDVPIPLLALRMQIGSGVNIVVQVGRHVDGSRKVSHITEVVGFDAESGRYELVDIYERVYRGLDEEGRVLSELVPSGKLPHCLRQVRAQGLDFPDEVHDAVRQAELD